MMIRKKLLFLALSSLALMVIAKTWGAFHVSAAGPEFAATTFESDAAYEAANRVAAIYLSPVLNNPVKIAKAIRSDFVRIVYYDGQIYDYKIALWPSSAPLNDPKKMQAVNSPGRISAYDRQKERAAEEKCARGIGSTVVYDTGYWGQSFGVDPENPNRIVHVAFWVDTGQVRVRFDDCRGK